jgi:hypothetical protein
MVTFQPSFHHHVVESTVLEGHRPKPLSCTYQLWPTHSVTVQAVCQEGRPGNCVVKPRSTPKSISTHIAAQMSARTHAQHGCMSNFCMPAQAAFAMAMLGPMQPHSALVWIQGDIVAMRPHHLAVLVVPGCCEPQSCVRIELHAWDVRLHACKQCWQRTC